MRHTFIDQHKLSKLEVEPTEDGFVELAIKNGREDDDMYCRVYVPDLIKVLKEIMVSPYGHRYFPDYPCHDLRIHPPC